MRREHAALDVFHNTSGHTVDLDYDFTVCAPPHRVRGGPPELLTTAANARIVVNPGGVGSPTGLVVRIVGVVAFLVVVWLSVFGRRRAPVLSDRRRRPRRCGCTGSAWP